MKKPDLLGFPSPGADRARCDGSPLFMSEGTGQEQWRGYDFTISENESTILLFGVGRDYEFIAEEKESGGSGVMRSMPC